MPNEIFKSFSTPQEVASFPRLQQLIRIDVDGDGDVFWEGQFVEGFADEAA
jgi:hypothetical protein